MKFEKKLQDLFDKYLSTLDDTVEDEWYMTEKCLAEHFFKDFMLWLSKQK